MKTASQSRLFIYGSVLAIFVLIGSGMYVLVIRPEYEAERYNRQLEHAAADLQTSLASLAKTTQLDIFNNSDRTSSEHHRDIDTINKSIAATRMQLNDFRVASDDLASRSHLPFRSSYYTAEIGRQNARNIVSQTSDVLNQYEGLTSFLKQYYTRNNTFVDITTRVNTASNLDTLIAQHYQIKNDGKTLAGFATELKKLQAPTEYSKMLSQAAEIYDTAARGLDMLSYGLYVNSAADKNGGITLVEQAANHYYNTLADLPVDIGQHSYILTQVNELPDKTNIITSSSTGRK